QSEAWLQAELGLRRADSLEELVNEVLAELLDQPRADTGLGDLAERGLLLGREVRDLEAVLAKGGEHVVGERLRETPAGRGGNAPGERHRLLQLGRQLLEPLLADDDEGEAVDVVVDSDVAQHLV